MDEITTHPAHELAMEMCALIANFAEEPDELSETEFSQAMTATAITLASLVRFGSEDDIAHAEQTVSQFCQQAMRIVMTNAGSNKEVH